MDNDLNNMDSSIPTDNIEELVNKLMNPDQNSEVDPSGFVIYEDGWTEEKVIEKIKKFEAEFKKYSPNYLKKLDDCYASYKKQNVITEGISVKVPEIFALIEVELPHLLNSLFGQSKVIDAKAKFIDPKEERTYKIIGFLNNLIKEITDGERKTKNIIKNELIYGTSIIKVWWENETEEDIDPMSGELVEVNSSHANFDLIDPYTFAWDINNESQNIQECQWLRERIHLSKEKMKMMRDSGQCGMFSDDDMTATENKGKSSRGQVKENLGDTTYYDEYSAQLYYEQEGKTLSKEYIIWVLAGNKVIKFHPSKMNRKMYCMCRAYDMPNELMGIGEPDVVGALASHASYIHFQLAKTIKRVGQAMAILTPDANMSPEELRLVEDGVFFVDDPKGLTFQPTMDPTNVEVLIKSKEYIDKQIEATTGIGPALQGESIGDVSATEASYVFQNASNRLSLKLNSLQNDFMKKLAEMLFLITKQTLQAPIVYFDHNNNNIEMSPQDFVGNYNFKCEGSISQANKALQLAQNTGLITQMIQLVGASQNSSTPLDFNANEMLQGLISPYTDTPDLSRFVFPQPPPQPMPPPVPPKFPHQTVAPNAEGMIQNAGLDPEGIANTPPGATLNPQSQTPPAMPHVPNLGNTHGAALKLQS